LGVKKRLFLPGDGWERRIDFFGAKGKKRGCWQALGGGKNVTQKRKAGFWTGIGGKIRNSRNSQAEKRPGANFRAPRKGGVDIFFGGAKRPKPFKRQMAPQLPGKRKNGEAGREDHLYWNHWEDYISGGGDRLYKSGAG